MKAEEIRNLTNAELAEKLAALKVDLMNLRFRHAMGQLENPMLINSCKKDIARINTEIRARELN